MLKTFAFLCSAALTATPALAQDVASSGGNVYVGAVAGYHDLGTDVPGDEGGPILGGVIGFDLPSSGPFVLGVEGNLHAGRNAIDLEYGAAARLGYRFPSGGLVYVRGGYQWIDVDAGAIAGVDLDTDDDDLGVSDLADDYLVGIGGEFALSDPRMRLRVGVDTVSFDSIRPTAGLIFQF